MDSPSAFHASACGVVVSELNAGRNRGSLGRVIPIPCHQAISKINNAELAAGNPGADVGLISTDFAIDKSEHGVLNPDAASRSPATASRSPVADEATTHGGHLGGLPSEESCARASEGEVVFDELTVLESNRRIQSISSGCNRRRC